MHHHIQPRAIFKRSNLELKGSAPQLLAGCVSVTHCLDCVSVSDSDLSACTSISLHSEHAALLQGRECHCLPLTDEEAEAQKDTIPEAALEQDAAKAAPCKQSEDGAAVMRVYNPLHKDFGPDEPQGQSRLKCERYRLIYLALKKKRGNSGRQKSEHWESGSRCFGSLEVLRAGTRPSAFLLIVAIALNQWEAGELEIALAKTP